MMNWLRNVFVIAGIVTNGATFAGVFDTSFVYQGQLRDNGVPVNGEVDMVFSLFDSQEEGTQEGPTLTFDGVSSDRVMVDHGLFDVSLEFGVEVFNGTDRWLEISVRTPPGIGDYEVLSPRHRVAPTPYALQTRGMFVDNTAFVGIGTVNPQVRLHVEGGSDADTSSGGFLQLGPSSGSNLALDNNEVMARNNGSVAGLAINAAGGNVTMVQGGTGNVGIGVASPATKLQVDGGTDSAAGGGGYLVLGSETGPNISFDNNEIMARNAGVVARLALNADGGEVTVGQAGPGFLGIGTTTPVVRLHVAGGTDASLNDGSGYIVVGSQDGANVVFDENEIIARNNAAVSSLFLNHNGGDVIISAVGTGRLGVGRSPTANQLEVNGQASKTTAGAFIANSDARIKTDVKTVSNAIETLNRVRLVTFRYTDAHRANHPEIADQVYMNVIAQEFREVFPDWVKGSGEFLENGDEILQVDPYPITIYAAAAVQELDRVVRRHEGELSALQRNASAIEILRKENSVLRAQLTELAARMNQLDQRIANANPTMGSPELAGSR